MTDLILAAARRIRLPIPLLETGLFVMVLALVAYPG